MMSVYAKLLRRVSYSRCLYYNSIVFRKLIGTNHLPQCVIHNTRSLSFCRICKKHKSLETEQKEVKTLSENTVSDNVPLIVKMLCNDFKKENSTEQIEHNPHDKEHLSVAELKQTLDNIAWDVKASIKKELRNMETVDNSEEISNYSDLQQGDDFIEHIDLDGNKTAPRRQTKLHVKKDVTGTADPSVPKTDIPCSGCGAVLHCQDPSVPGYMSSEKLTELTTDELKCSLCQRCHLMTHHNICLNIRVDENEYPQIISKINTSRGLILVIVDLTDFPNSIFRGLLEYVGHNRPLYIIGNKADLIARDDKGYLHHVKESLIRECEASGLNPSGKNIKHVCLVSAKTGYGIEQLVTKLMSQWKLQGHVFLVGSTNVGKSSLFNALLGSDYCKSHVRDLIHRATVSTWPGTTISLLKFPIVNPEPWKLTARVNRLKEQSTKEVMQKQMKKHEEEDNKEKKGFRLKGRVGVTDFRGPKRKLAEERLGYEGQEIVSFEMADNDTIRTCSDQVEEVTPPDMSFDEKLTESKWTFDTPGVVNSEQIINFLSPEELQLVLPRSYIIPRVFVVKPSQVLFVSGLGRIDYIQGNKSIYLTVHCSPNLPLHVVDGSDAEEFYSHRVGTKELGVPLDLPDREKSLPALEGKDIDMVGMTWKQASSDIQLSSLGWVSVTAGFNMKVTLRVYTPGGRGIYVRSPALLPHFLSFKGTRVGKSALYRPKKNKA